MRVVRMLHRAALAAFVLLLAALTLCALALTAQNGVGDAPAKRSTAPKRIRSACLQRS